MKKEHSIKTRFGYLLFEMKCESSFESTLSGVSPFNRLFPLKPKNPI